MRMLRCLSGLARENTIINKYIRIASIVEKMRERINLDRMNIF